ncbi:hypothetical protein HMPREF0519_2108 [Lentilactobacillus hilgardii DSM 20176 = ATCC 8290]|uniref:Uncharacterized protein n=1 Tax=Lentilactobacillus hilgardii (strain ATCC 8290 / DSM 20176 / CCUG 30140 / JCM 1155 / KCTC 3500 / NBRC 15886 / NCIMB 8040 / NRRL B-1843 / 9) TaxID=1423757 RepID=C0XLJ7_LENH9|nr:hypothetical protein HMPREF0519_2108 [Lentilactobacillus hilgardii DSM 20176 = ATCC 8290]
MVVIQLDPIVIMPSRVKARNGQINLIILKVKIGANVPIIIQRIKIVLLKEDERQPVIVLVPIVKAVKIIIVTIVIALNEIMILVRAPIIHSLELIIMRTLVRQLIQATVIAPVVRVAQVPIMQIIAILAVAGLAVA